MARKITRQARQGQRQSWGDRATVSAVQAACRLGLRRQAVLLPILASYARRYPGRFPYPSQVTMAARVGVTRETVTRWLGDLERAGLVAVWRTCAAPGGPGGQLTRRSNRYLLLATAALVKACPVPRRRSHLRDRDDTRPPSGGGEPPPPPAIEPPWALPPLPPDPRARVEALRLRLWPLPRE